MSVKDLEGVMCKAWNLWVVEVKSVHWSGLIYKFYNSVRCFALNRTNDSYSIESLLRKDMIKHRSQKREVSFACYGRHKFE
jgi:hypothetical protein